MCQLWALHVVTKRQFFTFIIDNTGSHIICMQFNRNTTRHKLSVNTFQHIQTQSKPHTAPQRISANR